MDKSRDLSPDTSLAEEFVERACDSSAFGTKVAVAYGGECLDGQEEVDLSLQDKSVDYNSSMDIHKDGECCWLEALLRCRVQC